ncbi:hypothetical protein SHL15_2047 [Streptomyces hygroscopicus subsp. limoneus]|nr:hypothetical protein SHL15_2047 [Streptomyces hygroscopicus subsp. limoneus]
MAEAYIVEAVRTPVGRRGGGLPAVPPGRAGAHRAGGALREAGRIAVMEGWRPGPTADKGARWTPAEAGEAARKLLAEAEPPGKVYGA